MSADTVTSDGIELPSVPDEVRRACSRGYLLGLALSACIWVLLGVATTLTVTSPLVPELPSIAISQYSHASATHEASMSGAPFQVRFD